MIENIYLFENVFNYVCYINRNYDILKTLKTYEPTIINLYATYKGLKFLRLI